MKYICLGYYEPAKNAAMTEDERNAMFDECFEYNDYLRANGHADRGEALQPPDTALTLHWKNGKVATTDGPYVETKEQLGGVGVLEARDMNHAVQLMSPASDLEVRDVVGDTTSGGHERNYSGKRAATAKGRCTLKTVLVCHGPNRQSDGTRKESRGQCALSTVAKRPRHSSKTG